MSRLCEIHLRDALVMGDEATKHALDNDDCEGCYEESGRDPYDRDFTEPYEP